MYRNRTIGSVSGDLPEDTITQLREQLSGACTTEIASFDQFKALLSDDNTSKSFDHIMFDTAPTGHTLRLLELPAAWSKFIEDNPEGATCLGPLSGLESQQKQYLKAVEILSDPEMTWLVMVSRPEKSALTEADRSGKELRELGIRNQILEINGIFKPVDHSDPLATAIENLQIEKMQNMPEFIKSLPKYEIPLKSYNLVGTDKNQKICQRTRQRTIQKTIEEKVREDRYTRNKRADRTTQTERQRSGNGNGKGGVGKTTVAISIAAGLARKGLPIHLSTTGPAGNIKISRIDPKLEIQKYIDNVMRTNGKNMYEDQRKLLRDDLEYHVQRKL